MKSNFLTFDLAQKYPTTAATVKELIAINDEFDAVHQFIKSALSSKKADKAVGYTPGVEAVQPAVRVSNVLDKNPRGAQVLMEYWGIDSLNMEMICSFLAHSTMPEFPLQLACRMLATVVQGNTRMYQPVQQATFLSLFMSQSEPGKTMQFGCERNTRRMLQVFGYLLLRAMQVRMENMGTAETLTRKRLLTAVEMIGQYADEQYILIDDSNWRELLLVYLANAID